ncbi:hypothetical protein C0583_05095 [Candidatus Parcubacteria bacterium]|nr:MAG: hypothetical protein C0583_05095 [Candidatus Parcubacteria bacterium]
MATKQINLKKKKSIIGKKEIVVVIFAVVFTTIGIKASDNIAKNKLMDEVVEGRCPKGMTLIPYSGGDFCIDIYEVSTSDDCSYNDPQNQTESLVNLDDPSCMPETKVSALPWRNISQDQAKRACAKAGKRLPTNSEWMQASLGTPDISSAWTEDDCQVSSNWASQPGLSGSASKCISSYGVFDMIGNVWEWVDGVVEDGMYDGKALPQAGYIDSTDGQGLPGETNTSEPNVNYSEDYFWLKSKGTRGMVRGGYWNNESDAGVYSLYAVTPPSSVEPGIGFRCVK